MKKLLIVVAIGAAFYLYKNPPIGTAVLSASEIKELKQQWNDTDNSRVVAFDGSFGVKRLSSRERKAAKEAGVIPVRITAILAEIKGNRQRRLSGTCHLYVLDKDKKVVFNKTVSLAKMCPS